ncbi:hypothetical protein MHYP_G00310710 [Metynnis hypsauchen]
MHLMHFNVRAVHIPGKLLVVADTLSRNPVDITSSDTEADVKANVEAVKGRICRRYKVAYQGTEAIGISWVVKQGLGPQSAVLS